MNVSLSIKHMELNSIQDGSLALLKDASKSLSKHKDKRYVIIGGWCPFLRNKHQISHPGTLDVDILFEEGYRSGSIAEVIETFLEDGFFPSAKHAFQLLKPFKIKGKSFVYNIDLLHPNMSEEKDIMGMFVDHLDLDVPLRNDSTETKMKKSIVLPNSKIIFEENLFNEFECDGQTFNLVDWNGMFLTKIDSCQKQKRERDSFDIYLGFLNNGIDVNHIRRFSQKYESINNSLDKFKQYLKKNRGIFNQNITSYCKTIIGSPAQEILNKI